MAIRITEFMSSGTPGEFIEFTNTGLTAIDMTGWSFDDSSRAPGSADLTDFGLVQPNESVILTEATAADFRTAWGLAATIKIIGGLTNNLGGSGDEINLYDNTNALVDRLTYSGSFAASANSRWASAAALGLNDVSQWTLASVGDAQSSFSATSGNVGNPGFTNFAPPTGSAPTIQAASATPFLNVPATGSGVVSGVLNDRTDPAKKFGINFTIADTDTAIETLTVTAISNNPAVANTVLTGSGANRNLKITPTGVGLTTIVVAVDDGQNTTNYTIQYGASAASVRANTRFHVGASDASTAVGIDADYMLVANDEDQKIRLYDRTDSGLPLNQFDFTSSLGLTDISGGNPREVDIEGSTRIGNRIYWIGSHSNSSGGGSRPNRYRVFATDLTGSGAGTTLNYVGHYSNLRSELIAWGDANGYNFTASAATGNIPEDPELDGFNIEGLTIAPNGTTGYVAFRAPNVPTSDRTKAVIAPITNFTDLVTGAASAAVIGSPIELDLGGRGIRSIERNANDEYLIVAGPADQATGTAPKDFRLYTWTGNPTDRPVLRAANLTALNTGGSFESIVSLPDSLGNRSKIQLLVDNGDTDFYANGSAAKDLTTNLQKFRSETVTLGKSIIRGTAGVDTLVGTAEDDVITGFAGSDTLTGNGGNDRFIYTSRSHRIDTITDFSVGDQIVLTALFQRTTSLQGLTYAEAVSGGYLSFATQGSTAILRLDLDGSAGGASSPAAFIRFNGLSVAQLNDAANFVV